MTFTLPSAATVLHSIGVELAIFVLTLFLAVFLKKTSLARGHKAVASKQEAREPSKPLAAGQEVTEATTSQSLLKPARQRVNETPTTRLSSKDGAHLMDEVVSSMREQPSMKTATKALGTYSELREILKERRLSEIANRARTTPVEFFTVLVQCACRAGRAHLVEGIIDEMVRHGVVRPLDFYESAMKQLAGQKHYHLALNMYDRIVNDNLEPSGVTCSCLISFAAEVGELSRAIYFFEKLSSITTPSIRAYMTVLRVHAKRLDWPASLAVYNDMLNRGASLDSLVLNVVLATGVAADQVEGAEALLREASVMEPPICDLVSYNTLIKGYAQRSDGVKALQLMTMMRERGLVPNAITFNTAMDASVRGMRISTAWDLLAVMREARIKPDKFTCSILVKGLSRGCSVEQVRACLDLLSEVGHACDATLRSTLLHAVLDAASNLQQSDLAMYSLTQMWQTGVVPSVNAYRQLVSVLSQDTNASHCGQLWTRMLEDDQRLQPQLVMALLDAYLKHGQMAEAMTSFARLECKVRQHGSERKRRECMAMYEECRAGFIRSLCRAGREAEATELYLKARAGGSAATIDCVTGMALVRTQAEAQNISGAWMTIEDMMDLGHRPNDTALQTFLTACLRQTHSTYGKAFLEKAVHLNITLSQGTYSLLLKLFSRCNQFQDGMSVLDDMIVRQRQEPPAPAVVSFIKACFASRQTAKAFEVVEKLQADKGSTPLDISIYKAALAGCASMGSSEKGLALIEKARSLGLQISAEAMSTASVPVNFLR
mmetsp:Transcript_36931/g.86556  ORF Transcript_36931/g.86556 Transcript_36931/m.86556 type:complete len:775 (-) Transcript_36931:184-2508(-)